MKAYGMVIIAFLILMASGQSSFASDDMERINLKVKQILRDIEKDEFPVVVMRFDNLVSEGSPPDFKFYYKNDKLIACQIDVGHETWGIRFSYFFDEDGRIIKYLKEVSSRPDNPPRKAIFYDKKGDVIWSNIKKPPVKAEEILKHFKYFNTQAESFGMEF